MTEQDFVRVAHIFDRGVAIAADIKTKVGPKLKDFKAALADGGSDYPELVELGEEVKAWANTFPAIGLHH
jgi:hypothetical protein